MKIGFIDARKAAEQTPAEQATFEALVASCWEPLWRYAYRTTGNRDDAEDLLSETLVDGFRSFAQFRGDTSFCRWMYRIMTTTRIDMVRRSRSRNTVSLDAPAREFDSLAGIRDLPDESADPESIVVGPMLSEEVQRALNALPEEFRAVVVVVDLEQMDYAEASRILRTPIGTIRSRLHRGRALLRKSLANR